MSINHTMCADCKVEYDDSGVCPNCGNMKPSAEDKATPSMAVRSTKSGKSHRAALSTKSRVSARPSTVVNTVKAVFAGLSNSPIRRKDVSTKSSSKRRNFAAGLVEIAPQAPVLPENLVRPGLSIPEDQRVCYNPACKWLHDKDKNPDGRPLNLYRKMPDGTTLDKGVCPKCRSPFNFGAIPIGTSIGQYEIVGPLAIGGCGFIYIAFDKAVGRHVILKGLLNSRDPDQQANAVLERKFLAELQDPHVVNILNFVTNVDEESQEQQTFIVMEFIDGQTLKSIKKKYMKEHNNEPLPLTEAIYYTLGILPAFSYLHKRKVIYCDFKMDNAMVQGERMRLIDLGGARQQDDDDGAFYLTRGYAAPEACSDNPVVSVSSDLYTIGRTLAILALNFDWQEEHEFSMPAPDAEPLFAKYECFYRFLLRCCNEDPDQRFQSADEMSDQLLGVLNEIVAIDAQDQKPVQSSLFSADVLRESGTPTYRSIPELKIDQDDPARTLIETALVTNDVKEQVSLLQQAIQQYPNSAEAPLRLASVFTDLGQHKEAETLLDASITKNPFDFRNIWMRGRLVLARGEFAEAYKHFDAVYSEVPGELAPKLALAITAELKGDPDTAIRYYELVSGVDRNYVTACFGLARVLATRDVEAAAEAYERVPASSIAYVPALMAKVRTILAGTLNAEGLAQLTSTLARVAGDNLEMHRLRADVFKGVSEQLASGKMTAAAGSNILGVEIKEQHLRAATETELRQCARFANTADERAEFVKQANAIVMAMVAGSLDRDGVGQLSETLKRIAADTMAMHHLRADAFVAAVQRIDAGQVQALRDVKLADVDFDARALRTAAEHELRACARFADKDEDKVMFINMANHVRPRTVW